MPYHSSRRILDLTVVDEGGTVHSLGHVDLVAARARAAAEVRRDAAPSAIPPPDPEIVFLTQGNECVNSYLLSSWYAVYHLGEVLDGLGFDLSEFERVLDFGCGGGRVLRGFPQLYPHLELYGSDYNQKLIDWASAHFPEEFHFNQNQLHPPLPYDDDFFDLVYMISVFTHLSLDCQMAWLAELRRVLKPGRPLVLTLHGLGVLPSYRYGNAQLYLALLEKGYWENCFEVEGANQYVTAHLPGFACDTLFKDWNVLASLPRGAQGNRLHDSRLNFAHTHDMWVLTAD